MSHWPGPDLEDYITSALRVVDSEGEHGTSIRRSYRGQMVLSAEQFAGLVAILEPYRGEVEAALLDYDEEESGSWRDYAGFVVDDRIPEDAWNRAEDYLRALDAPTTPGLLS